MCREKLLDTFYLQLVLLYSSSSKLIFGDWSKNVYEECWRISDFSQ